MAQQRSMKRKSTSRERQSGSKRDEMSDLRESFEQTLLVVDATVTGAVIAGVAPQAFEAVLSYWFLHCAVGSRSRSKEVFQKWTSDLTLVWEPVLRCIMEFVNDFEGELDDCGELAELKYLQETCGVRKAELLELEERRHSKKAVEILEWLMNTLGADEKLLMVAVEMSFLVTWFKIAALAKDVEDDVYLIVRQYLPAVYRSYNEVMANA